MKEAIDKIREELGPDAVILHSRNIEGSGAGRIEVTAAIEAEAGDAISAYGNAAASATGNSAGNVFRGVPEITTTAKARNVDFLVSDEDVGEAGSVIYPRKQSRQRRKQGPHGARSSEALPEISMKLSEMHESMLKNDVDDFVAESLVKTAMAERDILTKGNIESEVLPRSVEKMIRCAGPIRASAVGPKIVALVGPTGVGKTTTIAKLGTRFAVMEGRSVAFITVDVQRSVAVQQLKMYADMLGTPFEVALNPVELRRAIKKFRNMEFIFIDTGGRSPYKWMSILELSSFFKGIEDLEIHLVLSAATSTNENVAAVERFSAIPVSRLIFTKIDEINDHGVVVNVSSRSNKPVSYFTMGQNVPDDIEIAEYGKISQLISKPRGQKK